MTLGSSKSYEGSGSRGEIENIDQSISLYGALEWQLEYKKDQELTC